MNEYLETGPADDKLREIVISLLEEADQLVEGVTEENVLQVTEEYLNEHPEEDSLLEIVVYLLEEAKLLGGVSNPNILEVLDDIRTIKNVVLVKDSFGYSSNKLKVKGIDSRIVRTFYCRKDCRKDQKGMCERIRALAAQGMKMEITYQVNGCIVLVIGTKP